MKAFKYYQKSADLRHVDGLYNVGRCYEYGIGVEKDIEKAFEYYLKSAYMGHIDGRHKISPAWYPFHDPYITSGNMDIGDCIRDFQLQSTQYNEIIEWIPFYRLTNLTKVGEGAFSKVFRQPGWMVYVQLKIMYRYVI
ncbi:hypothetical protein C2G38_1703997 [Gigaspora rosea]|uniref:Protein kinase domain-containing protein n=1 Tax=Gigaspora rosea TaxID=44941 RepID=A0A397W2D6_9GLOM|nr:hypothetical protein C2G38_1703997 [Gigaspora rosea]